MKAFLSLTLTLCLSVPAPCQQPRTTGEESLNSFLALPLKPAEVPTPLDMQTLESKIRGDFDIRNIIHQRGLRVMLPDSMRKNKDSIEVALSELLRKAGFSPKERGRTKIEFVNWEQAVDDAAKLAAIDSAKTKLPAGITAQEKLTLHLKQLFQGTFKYFKETPARLREVPSMISQIPSIPKFLWQSRQVPTWREMAVGAGTKAIPFSAALIAYWKVYSHNPVALVMASSLSFALDTFHGLFCATWNNFQSRLADRGTSFQTIFNIVYGKVWGVAFRSIAYGAGVAPESPLSWAFVFGNIFQDVVGGYTSSKAWQGLSQYAQRGNISYETRNLVLQGRDMIMMLTGLAFGLGSHWWMAFFGSQVFIDSVLYAVGKFSETRPMVIIVPKDEAPKMIDLLTPREITDRCSGALAKEL